MTLQQDLQQFIGTEHWYKVPLSSICITDGVKYFADKGGAYWAVDDIVATSMILDQPFLSVKVISKDSKATIIYEDGNYKKLRERNYPFTDLPDGTYEFYVTDNVMLLTSEY